MKATVAAILLCTIPVAVECADEAPKKAVYGREQMLVGEHLLISFSVHAKVVVLEGNLDKVLVPKLQSLPIYPSEALHAGVVGEAIVAFTITKGGNVEGVRVVKSTHKEFAQSSVAAVSQWSFSRPEDRGKPVQLAVQATFLFSIFDEQGE